MLPWQVLHFVDGVHVIKDSALFGSRIVGFKGLKV